jgi:mRNA interferase RelE/StbE
MVVEFLARFSKDLDAVHQKNVKQQLAKVILQVESASSLKDIPNLKKLAGFKSAYRIRIGDYRVGLFVEGNKAQFARIAHRKEIYRLFP